MTIFWCLSARRSGWMGAQAKGKENLLGEREFAEIDVVFGRCDKVDELADLGLEGGVVEELKEVDVVGLGAEVLLEKVVDGTLEHERVVDGDKVHALYAEPTWLSATSDRLVHHVV